MISHIHLFVILRINMLRRMSFPCRRKQLLACWNFDPEGRPTIDDLIEVLLANPTLAVSCLDTPSPSVNPVDESHHVLSRLRPDPVARHTANRSTSGFFSHALPLPPDPFHLLHTHRSGVDRPMSEPSTDVEVTAMLEWCWQMKRPEQVVGSLDGSDEISLAGVSGTSSPSHTQGTWSAVRKESTDSDYSSSCSKAYSHVALTPKHSAKLC